MKRVDLERRLRQHARVSIEGGSRSVSLNPANGEIASLLRHREIKEGTVRNICSQLEIPRP